MEKLQPTKLWFIQKRKNGRHTKTQKHTINGKIRTHDIVGGALNRSATRTHNAEKSERNKHTEHERVQFWGTTNYPTARARPTGQTNFFEFAQTAKFTSFCLRFSLFCN